MRREFWIGSALLIVTVAVYWPVRDCDFVNFDDPVYVTRNPYVLMGLTKSGIHWAFTTDHTGNWHPLTWISHMMDCQLYGAKPRWHHLTNLFFHLANIVLLFGILRGMTGAVWRSALVVGLFAWHPMHVESVAWVAERKDVLSTFFGLAAIWGYARYARASEYPCPQSEIQPASSEGEGMASTALDSRAGNQYRKTSNKKSAAFFALSLLFFSLSLMAKPMLVTLPFVLLLLDWWPLQRIAISRFDLPARPTTQWLRIVSEKVPFLALAIASCIVTYLVQQKGGNVSSLGLVPLSARLGNLPVAYMCYVAKFLLPTDLCVLYPFTGPWPLETVAGTSLLLALMFAAMIFWGWNRPYLLVGWLVFVGTLVPVIGLIQVGQQYMADRYTYFPFIGLSIALVWGLAAALGRWPKSMTAIASAVLLGLIWSTHEQLAYWKNSMALFERDLAVEGDNPTALWNLADALFQQGRFAEGETPMRKVVAMAPNRAPIQTELAFGLSQQGKSAEAIAHYQIAVQLNPQLPEALSGLAWILATDPDATNRNGAQAAILAERACALTGYSNPVFVMVLGAAYAESGRFAEAVQAADRSLQLAQATGDQGTADRVGRCLELYRANRPYHQGDF